VSHLLYFDKSIIKLLDEYNTNTILFDLIDVYVGRSTMTPHPSAPRFLSCRPKHVLMPNVHVNLSVAKYVLRKLDTFSRDFLKNAEKIWLLTSIKSMRLVYENSILFQVVTEVVNWSSELEDEAFVEYFSQNPFIKVRLKLAEMENTLMAGDMFVRGEYFSTTMGYMPDREVIDLKGRQVSNIEAYVYGDRFTIFRLPTIYVYTHPIRGRIYVSYKQLAYPNENGLEVRKVDYDVVGYKYKICSMTKDTYFNFPTRGQYVINSEYDKIFNSYYVKIGRARGAANVIE